MLRHKKVSFFEAVSMLGSGDTHPDGFASTKKMLTNVSIKESDVVLDMGCGTGKTSCYIAEHFGCRVVGADLSVGMISSATERAKKKSISNMVEFIVADIEDIPIVENSFDYIFVESVLIYVDKKKAFSEMKRVLKPNGILCFNEFTWLKKPKSLLVQKTKDVLDAPAEILMTDDWDLLVRENGFIDIRSTTARFRMNLYYQIKKLSAQGLRSFYILYKSIMNPNILKKIFEIKQHFQKNSEYFGYSIFIAQNAKNEIL
ncbi:MAG: class I SAM-dependent methyltransferase [Nanoarchaeota archaeon]|nr:class I SAM-dependent methyltransferase [Nanoarchaeota archaeon]